MDEVRELIAEGNEAAAEAAVARAVLAAGPLEQAKVASAGARLAQRAGRPELAARLYQKAQRLDPRDAEHPHDRGLSLLEAGHVGLAAQAQAEALAIDPEHVGARAQRASALEALGDDEGAAREIGGVLSRIGPHVTLHARREAARERAQLARRRRLVGSPMARLRSSHLVGAVFASEGAAAGSASLRSTFARLTAALDAAGRIAELRIVFDDMDASLSRSDLAYGGTTEDEHQRRVPLDEFTAAAVVFLSEALGVEADRARRVLRWLLTAEAGRGPHRLAAAHVSWLVVEEEGERRYGLSVAPAPELV